MAVRRLADDTLQPEDFKFSRSNRPVVKQWMKKYPSDRKASAVIPLLMLAQEQEGWVTRASIEHIAETLEMPYIRVLEVATFYTQFMLKPVGNKAHIQVCGTTPCRLRGAGDLIEVCKRKIGNTQFETTSDGALSWEEVECQGACVNAPMVMIFKDTYEDLTSERLEEIIEAFEAGKGDTIAPGPQIDRIYSAPVGGPTSCSQEIKSPSKRAPKAERTAEPKEIKATKKARPSDHAGKTGPAIDTPVGKEKSKKAVASKKSSAQKAGVEMPSESLKREAHEDAPGRPEGVEKPVEPDNLKLISGVGPKIEGVLNGLGIYKFSQIANWTKTQRDWVDGYLKFRGRIDRDDWVTQATELANQSK